MVNSRQVLPALSACGGGGDGDALGPAPLISVALPKTGQTTCYDTSVPPAAVDTSFPVWPVRAGQ